MLLVQKYNFGSELLLELEKLNFPIVFCEIPLTMIKQGLFPFDHNNRRTVSTLSYKPSIINIYHHHHAL